MLVVLLFIHSHPDPRNPIGLSPIDVESFRTLAQHLATTLDGPFWSGGRSSTWMGGSRIGDNEVPIDRIIAVGTVQFLSPISPSGDADIDDRQKNALATFRRKNARGGAMS